MRSLMLGLLALAFGATPASAAVIQLDDRSSPEDNSPTIAIVVRAAPGETNRVTVRRVPGGIRIQDGGGTPLTGDCEPGGAGRFCRGDYFGTVDVFLGDGDDTLDHAWYGFVDASAGDDDIRVSRGIFSLVGGAGADSLDATRAAEASVSYADHAAGVSVTVNGLADDGAPGEGDNVLGTITSIVGGDGDDQLEAGRLTTSLFGAAGNDVLTGSPERDYLTGGQGDDQLLAGDGTDSLDGGPGADILSGGDGLDEASYGGFAPLTLSIGDGANDGAAGEGDDIRSDIESLVGGSGDDLLIGDSDPNRLAGFGGHDVLRGGGGGDELRGWGDGDELDGGAGRDVVSTLARRLARTPDRALLRDGEVDELACAGSGVFAEADADDELEECAPAVVIHRRGQIRPHRRLTLFVRCPVATAVPCRGRVWVHLQGRRRPVEEGRRLSRAVRFGPIRAGERTRLRVLIRGRVPRGAYVYATAVTRRNDGLKTRTITANVLP